MFLRLLLGFQVSAQRTIPASTSVKALFLAGAGMLCIFHAWGLVPWKANVLMTCRFEFVWQQMNVLFNPFQVYFVHKETSRICSLKERPIRIIPPQVTMTRVNSGPLGVSGRNTTKHLGSARLYRGQRNNSRWFRVPPCFSSWSDGRELVAEPCSKRAVTEMKE